MYGSAGRWLNVIDVSKLGSPQTRPRLIMLAVRPGFPLPDWPRVTNWEVAHNDLREYNKIKLVNPAALGARGEFFVFPYWGLEGKEHISDWLKANRNTLTVTFVSEGDRCVPTLLASYWKHMRILVEMDSVRHYAAVLAFFRRPCDPERHNHRYPGKFCCGATNWECFREFWGPKLADRFKELLETEGEGKRLMIFRALTLQEYASLQGISIHWIESSHSWEKQYRMIGNAVHPFLFEAVGRELAAAIGVYLDCGSEGHVHTRLCDDIRKRLYGKDLGKDPGGNRNVLWKGQFSEYWWIEDETEMPEWLLVDPRKGDPRRQSKDAQNLAYLIPRQYRFPCFKGCGCRQNQNENLALVASCTPSSSHSCTNLSIDTHPSPHSFIL